MAFSYKKKSNKKKDKEKKQQQLKKYLLANIKDKVNLKNLYITVTF